MKLFLVIVTFFCLKNLVKSNHYVIDDEYSTASLKEVLKHPSEKSTRFLLFGVNPGEGFNLRRDVFIRMANLVVLLNKKQPNRWVLVLPLWYKLYHWRTQGIYDKNIDWSLFFDIESIKKLCPVVEQTEFIEALEGHPIEDVIIMQRYEEGWDGGEWKEKLDFKPCLDKNHFTKKGDLWKWKEQSITAKQLRCLSVQAEYSSLVPFLAKNITSNTILLGRGEMVMHGKYSEWSPEYWTARRSMRFSKKLVKIADDFRKEFLNSDDVTDQTVMEDDWRKSKKEAGTAKGGEYLGVHLRRADFTYSHAEEIPSIKGAAQQINTALQTLKISKVFVATDASDKEYDELKNAIQGEVYRYRPTSEVLSEITDGGVAIVDQYICSHARKFIGTKASTFSFRIHEEREITGFAAETTFNAFCPDKSPTSCEQPSKWRVVY